MKTKKRNIFLFVGVLVLMGSFIFFLVGGTGGVSKESIAVGALSALNKVLKLTPVEKDTKKEINAVNQIVQEFTKKDGIERRYLLMLQNNMELRPGGGFLGQYAVIRVKNGEVSDLFVEDANILDQRIGAKISPPYPFKRLMSIKKWKFRDSNFSPDFPTNVEKAKYFYGLAGGSNNFDGVVAVNATVLNKVLGLTGPVKVGGYEFNSENAVLKLEEVVEKAYLLNENLDTQNRKWIMKEMAPEIIERLFKLQNISKIADLVLEELRNKDVQLSFEDGDLQKTIEEVHWGGKMSTEWEGDYLMLVDANMGALKSDYFIEREIIYNVDLTLEKPVATVEQIYTHKATYGDWRTSDYHSYLRVYVPKGSTMIERKMVGWPNVQEEFNKTYFGVKVDVLINRDLHAFIKYELPAEVKDDYKLLIQKQSGVGDVPVTVKVRTQDGELEEKLILKKDVKLELKK